MFETLLQNYDLRRHGEKDPLSLSSPLLPFLFSYIQISSMRRGCIKLGNGRIRYDYVNV